MTETTRNVAILGATGSIGNSALDVIRGEHPRLRAVGLTAHRQMEVLFDRAREFQPDWIVLTDGRPLKPGGSLSKTRVYHGAEAIESLVQQPEVDVVLNAIVGSAGLRGTWAALEAGKTVALANKETMVVAGPLIRELAKKTSAQLLPVDSEHSAIFQCLQAGQFKEVARVVLTASGGPFRNLPAGDLANVTVEDALSHPTWAMGPKITVDSATMMNKALEVIEARWLFDLKPEQISVMIHPQSVVHSMVEYVDGAVVAQLSPPDMRLPIHYALNYPDRRPSVAARMDWSKCHTWEMFPPDPARFPALTLGFEAAAAGGTAGAVLNAANEVAVGRFLARDLSFKEIVPACQAVFRHHDFEPRPTLEQLLQADRWARQEMERWKCS